MPEPEHIDAAKVEVYRDEAGEYRWRARDTNGEIVAESGEGYERKLYAAKAAFDLFPEAEVSE